MTQSRTIQLSAVDPADQSYRITRAGEDSSALALSISAMGLAAPPALMERGDKDSGHDYIIVSGFKRWEACRDLGLKEIPCRVYGSDEAAACARAAVAENAFSRDLEPGEMVRAIGLLSRHMASSDIADQSPAIFNTQLNRNYVEALMKIDSLGEQALTLLDSGQISLKAARVLAEMPPDEAQSFLDLFSGIRASSGKQMEIVTWSREIAAREKIGLATLFSDEKIREARDASTGNQDMAAAGNRLRAALYIRRYPELTGAREKAASQARDLKLPPNIRLTLPENFESTDYSFTLTVRSPEEFAQSVTALSKLEGHPGLEQLLNR